MNLRIGGANAAKAPIASIASTARSGVKRSPIAFAQSSASYIPALWLCNEVKPKTSETVCSLVNANRSLLRPVKEQHRPVWGVTRRVGQSRGNPRIGGQKWGDVRESLTGTGVSVAPRWWQRQPFLRSHQREWRQWYQVGHRGLKDSTGLSRDYVAIGSCGSEFSIRPASPSGARVHRNSKRCRIQGPERWLRGGYRRCGIRCGR